MAAFGQGYRATLFLENLDAEGVQLEGVTMRVVAEEIDTTGSLVTDENTGDIIGVNGADEAVGAFTDAVGGPQTLFIQFSGTIRDEVVLSYFALLSPGDVLFDSTYSLYYATLLVYSGVGLYVQELDMGAVIRGAANVSFRLRSTQHGFVRNTALAS